MPCRLVVTDCARLFVTVRGGDVLRHQLDPQRYHFVNSPKLPPLRPMTRSGITLARRCLNGDQTEKSSPGRVCGITVIPIGLTLTGGRVHVSERIRSEALDSVRRRRFSPTLITWTNAQTFPNNIGLLAGWATDCMPSSSNSEKTGRASITTL